MIFPFEPYEGIQVSDIPMSHIRWLVDNDVTIHDADVLEEVRARFNNRLKEFTVGDTVWVPIATADWKTMLLGRMVVIDSLVTEFGTITAIRAGRRRYSIYTVLNKEEAIEALLNRLASCVLVVASHLTREMNADPAVINEDILDVCVDILRKFQEGRV